MEFKDIWDILVRRKWIIIQAFILVLATTGIITYFLPPVYEAKSKVLVESSGTTATMLSNLGLQDLSSLIGEKGATDIGTKITLIKVDPVINEVANRLQLRDENGDIYTALRLETAGVLYKFLPRPYVYVMEDIGSSSMTVLADSASLDEAIQLADTVAEIYVTETRKQRQRELIEAGKFIEDQIANVKKDYFDALNRVNEFQLTNNSLDTEIEIKVAIEKLGELMKQKEDNIIDISEAETKLRILKDKLATQDASNIFAVTITENAQIRDLLKSLSDLQIKLAGLLIERTAEHPEIVAVRKQIEETDKIIKRELSIYKNFSPEMVSLELELEALKAHLIGVNRNIEKYTKLAQTLPVKSSEMSKLKLALTASQNMYSSLLDTSFKIGVAKAMTVSDVRIVQYANRLDSLKPISPQRVLNLIVGAFLGLISGIGLALFIDHVDTTIKTSDDLKPFEKLYYLGSIPYMKKDSLIFKLDSKHPSVETFRTIRNSLQFATLKPQIGPILVTSCEPSAGKSTTVTDLAISFAQTGNKVLAIDTDLRNPSLHKFFNVSNQKGLTTLLSNKATTNEVIIDTNVEGVRLLPCGPVPPDPGLFIESEGLKKYLEQLRGSFDIIILDSPPLFIVSDAVILSKLVEATILVLESGRTDSKAVSEAQDLFEKAEVKKPGAIINKVKKKYGKYYYSSYYKNYYGSKGSK
ncbi:MAG: polysaccharide biosynthesis tyrosine autokinase [Nitrospiraceae bacterium]|nr:MAG: polysaccharide biosynthesis tyrosine autokinase [Nitrospiraceae bacterium]